MKLSLGTVVATPGVLASIHHDELVRALRRHARGDWGLVCAEDAGQNDQALDEGSRVLSAYEDSRGINFWVITEADRSVTTVLFPHEY